jgi:hypothetical protein
MEKNLEKNNVIDKRSIKLENVMRPDYIPFLSGRPDRDSTIEKDDLMDLEIVLNTTETVEDFLKNI